ncbi:hypothetical protein [Mesorhizobium sp. CAU 1732]|uniref:hypothetical protein n=1 Tax=Mesorhizobium sp. CAU 1732 TaxID=3140358 RepID=UPI0032607D03
MPLPAFDELPFNARPDLTPYLLHLTKNTDSEDKFSGYDNLVSILRTGEIWGSSSKRGFIKGPNKAACFMDVPFASLKYVLTPENSDPQAPRYEPYGIAVTKRYAYGKGCRPVLYLSDAETTELQIPRNELWRVVRFEVSKKGWISWLHEREWRCKGNFVLPSSVQAVFVRNTREAERLNKDLASSKSDFKCRPRAVVPLTVMCQGLLA